MKGNRQFLYPIYNFEIILTGVAVGGGWQALVAYVNIGCYYLFGLPLGFLLGYKANLGVEVIYHYSDCISIKISFDKIHKFSANC